MRILVFIGSLGTGGAERQALNLLTALDQKGFETTLVTFFAADKSLYSTLTHDTRIRIRSLFGRRSSVSTLNALKLAFAPFKLRRLIQKEAPTVIYSKLYFANLVARVACSGRLLGSLVWGIRSSDMRLNWKRRVPDHLCALLSSAVPLVISNSNAGVDVHSERGYRPRRFSVIPNGIDVQRFRFSATDRVAVRSELGISQDATVIGRIGRLDPMKGYEDLIRAVPSVLQELPDAVFLCIGTGLEGYAHRLEQLVEEAGVAASLRWLGARSDVHRLYSAMDISVSSSRYGEGFPNTIAESMACGIPCVTTDVGDSAFIVNDPAVVTKPGDFRALSDVIVNLARSKRNPPLKLLRERIVRNFSIDAMAESVVKEFSALNE